MTNTEQTTQNMTSGNSMKQIILFFLPLLWGNLFQQLYSLVDSIIVGKGISDQALAAVGATGTLNFLILGFVVGMTRGFGITFAQNFGKNDMAMLNAYIRAAKKLSITFGIAFTVVCVSLLNKFSYESYVVNYFLFREYSKRKNLIDILKKGRSFSIPNVYDDTYFENRISQLLDFEFKHRDLRLIENNSIVTIENTGALLECAPKVIREMLMYLGNGSFPIGVCGGS